MAITSVPSRSSIGNYDVTGLVAERPQHRWLATQLNTTAVQHTYIHVTHQDISQFHNNSTNNQQVYVQLSTATVEVLLLAFAAVCRAAAPLLLGTWRYAATSRSSMQRANDGTNTLTEEQLTLCDQCQ